MMVMWPSGCRCASKKSPFPGMNKKSPGLGDERSDDGGMTTGISAVFFFRGGAVEDDLS